MLIFVASSVGYFVEPTIVQVTDPKNKLMEEVRDQLMVALCIHCLYVL